MQKDIKKPLLSVSLATSDNKGSNSVEADQHRDRITRFGILKHRAKQQENFLWSLAKYKENYQNDKPNEESVRATKAAQKLLTCGNFLLFKNFYTIEKVKLAKLQVCSQHLLCPFCAGIRASKSIQKYSERIDEVLSKNRTLKPVLITFTVVNGPDLKERSAHLMKSFRTLLERRRDYLKKGRGFNEFCKINGAMYSYENTFNSKTQEWNVHLHMFALLDAWIDQPELSEYWRSITGDSYIVDVRRIKKEKGHGYSKGIQEVCKYTLKFTDLTVENTWEAFKVLQGKRLSGAFGSLYGVKIPDNPADDIDDSDLPYLEMVYKFVFGKQSYYDLTMTRHVEPQGQDNDDNEEKEGPTSDRGGGSGCSRVAKNEERNGAEVRRKEYSAPRNAPQFKRKRQHWQISPYTRVRVKQRIKRWDGFLYVLHL